MNDLDLTALNNVISAKAAKAARAGVSEGTFDVDVTVRVQGTLKVGKDYTRPPTVSIPVKEVLALFVARSGCTREDSIDLLRSCLTDAIAAKGKGKGAIVDTGAVDEVFEAQVAALIASLPETPVKGPVDADGLTCTVVEVPAGLALAAK